MELLKEIKIENHDLISRIKQPPLLTGKIDDWFGYGTEPEKDLDGDKQSFNSLRSKLVETVIDEVVINWIMNHSNILIDYQREIFIFKNYIVKKSVEKIIDKYDKNSKKNRRYSLQDINLSVFEESIFQSIRESIYFNLLTLQQKGIRDVKNIEIIVNGQQIQFSRDDFSSVIRGLVLTIIKMDSSVLEDIKVKIKENANHYGIDSNNFSFDSSAVEKFKKIERDNNSVSIESVNGNNKYKLDKINVQMITDIKQPKLMKKRFKLSFERYFAKRDINAEDNIKNNRK